MTPTLTTNTILHIEVVTLSMVKDPDVHNNILQFNN